MNESTSMLLAEISTMDVSKECTMMLHSIWQFRSKNGYGIFHFNEYRLDLLLPTITRDIVVGIL